MSLRVVRRPDGAPPAGNARPITEAGTRIGRAPECDLVLDDALRLVSRQHAWLAPQGGSAALLRCISTTAAIHVNGEPLPPGAERLVHDGDLLRLGGFEVLVEIEPQTVVVSRPLLRPQAPAVQPLPAPPPPAQPSMAPAVVSMPRRPAAVSAGVSMAPPAPMVPATPPVPVLPVVPPVAARVSRLDHHFDLDTVPDPLGLNLPVPAAEAPAREEPPAPPPAPPAPVAPPMGPTPAVQAFDASLSRAAALHAAEPTPAALAPAPPVRPNRPPDAALQALRQAFLHGAGLQEDAEFQMDPAWMEHLGALLRAATEGTLALLRTRAMAKRSIRAENTQIVARENNPLKFAPDGEQALQLLLSLQNRRGFLDPVAAVRDAHGDLQVHQLAMAAGMRAAVFELITRLGPEATEAAEGPAHGLTQSIPALRDAALWRRHKLGHERMLENLDDVFEAAFGREFVKAYEAQAKKDEPPLT